MSKLIIKRNVNFTAFGLPEWNDKDYEVPLVIHIDGAKVSIYLEKDKSGLSSKHKIDVLPRGRIEIEFDPAPMKLIDGLRFKLGSAEIAKKIYGIYSEAFEKFEALLVSRGNLKYLFWMRVMPESEFFRESGLIGDGAEWSIDGSEYSLFTPKLPKSRKINPMYKADQLLSSTKWKTLQEASDNGEFPSDELLELYRIRNKAYMHQKKTAAIEASIISETLLREYGLKVLKVRGFSNNKIKKIKDELTFNNLLNIILPLSLSKSEFSRISRSVLRVDHLRRIRNDLVHGNKSDKDIETSDVIAGAESAIKLVNYLKKKIEEGT